MEMSNRTRGILLVVTAVGWAVSAALCHGYAKLAMSAGITGSWVTVSQMVAGLVLSLGFTLVLKAARKQEMVVEWGITDNERNSNIDVLSLAAIGVCQGLATIMTNVSMELSSGALTHTVKCLEPGATLVLTYVFLKTRHTVPAVAAIAVVATGVSLFTIKDATFNLWGFLLALFSNFAYASRNVLGTISLSGKRIHPAFLYAVQTIVAAPLLMVTAYSFDPLPAAPSGDGKFYLFVAAVLHGVYSMLSFTILWLSTPITHAVINLAKRTTVVLFAIFWFKQTMLNSLSVVGLGVTVAGLGWYTKEKMPKKEAPRSVTDSQREEEQGKSVVLTVPSDDESEEATTVHSVRRVNLAVFAVGASLVVCLWAFAMRNVVM